MDTRRPIDEWLENDGVILEAAQDGSHSSQHIPDIVYRSLTERYSNTTRPPTFSLEHGYVAKNDELDMSGSPQTQHRLWAWGSQPLRLGTTVNRLSPSAEPATCRINLASSDNAPPSSCSKASPDILNENISN